MLNKLSANTKSTLRSLIYGFSFATILFYGTYKYNGIPSEEILQNLALQEAKNRESRKEMEKK